METTAVLLSSVLTAIWEIVNMQISDAVKSYA